MFVISKLFWNAIQPLSLVFLLGTLSLVFIALRWMRSQSLGFAFLRRSYSEGDRDGLGAFSRKMFSKTCFNAVVLAPEERTNSAGQALRSARSILAPREDR